MQPLHAMPGMGDSTTLTMPDFKGTLDPDSEYPDAVLTKPCLLPTLLAASRLLLSRVLPTAVSRPPTAPTP
jgi:hypothetical protein